MNPFMLFFVAPILILGAGVLLLWRRRRQGLLSAALAAAGTAALGVWAISQSRSSTAAIGVLFLPFYAGVSGLLAWTFVRYRQESGQGKRIGAWVALALAMTPAAALTVEGFRAREKNRERDLAQIEANRQADLHRQRIRLLLSQNPGQETAALSAELLRHLEDRNFVLQALLTKFVSGELLDRLSGSEDIGIVLEVARNPNTSSTILERIYRHQKYPDYFFQALAAHRNTPAVILRELYTRPRTISNLDRWLAGNPATPHDILMKLAESRDINTLQPLLQNQAIDCGLFVAIKSALPHSSRPGDSYSLGRINELEPALCAAR